MLKKVVLFFLILVVSFAALLLTTQSSNFAVRDTLSVAQDPGQVWQVLAEVERWPEWWPGVATARRGATWSEGAMFELVFQGNPTVGPARVERYRVGRELAFSRAGVLGSRAGTGFLLEPQAEGVLVTVETIIHGPQAVLARFTGREAFADYHRRLLTGLFQRLQPTTQAMEQESGNGR